MSAVALPEQLRGENYLVASYLMELPADADVLTRAEGFAVGQTIGTWLPVPGVTATMRAQYEGRVLAVVPVPGVDVDGPDTPALLTYLVRIALPGVSIGSNLPLLLTTVLGNDASTSVQAKLVDLELPDQLGLSGPRFGVDGVRDLVGVPDRPLLLNMIKPCTGLPPAAAAEIFRATALGGIDLVKDDELMGNPDYSPVVERVRLFTQVAREVAETTGVATVYLPNVTDRADRMLDTAQRAVDAGARAVMVAYAAAGYGTLQAVAEAVDVPVFGHFAATGPLFESARTGMAAHLACGLLPRAAGADLALVLSPYGGYPLRPLAYRRIVDQLRLPRPGMRPTFPVIGGGVHPGTVARYVGELGSDVVLGAGGAIQGHPGGATAGVLAMRQAIDAAVAGRPVRDAAAEHPELAAAVDAWGVLEG